MESVDQGGLITVEGVGEFDVLAVAQTGTVDASAAGQTIFCVETRRGLVVLSESADIFDLKDIGSSCVVNAISGNDVLLGSANGDTIAGGSGSDSLTGAGGDDLVIGDEALPSSFLHWLFGGEFDVI